MADYLTGAAYQRWYRQYNANLRAYIKQLDNLRLRAGELPLEEREATEQEIYTIDEHLEKAFARDFSPEGKPLETNEIFLENSKVLTNLFLQLLGKPARFVGIYKTEKDRVQQVHQEFKFKERLKAINDSVLLMGLKKAREQEFLKVGS